MANSEFTIKANDTRPAIQATLSANASDVITSVKFIMVDKAGGSVVNAGATIVSQPSATSGGVVKFQWAGPNTTTPGNYQGEFQVTFSDSRIETYPNSGYINIHIVPDLGS